MGSSSSTTCASPEYPESESSDHEPEQLYALIRLIDSQSWAELRALLYYIYDTGRYDRIAAELFRRDPGTYGGNALHRLCCFHPPLDLVLLIMNLEPRLISARDDLERTVLHIAAGCGASPRIISFFLGMNSDLAEVRDKFGISPLGAACCPSYYLLPHFMSRSDVNASDPSIMEAIADANTNFVSYQNHINKAYFRSTRRGDKQSDSNGNASKPVPASAKTRRRSSIFSSQKESNKYNSVTDSKRCNTIDSVASVSTVQSTASGNFLSRTSGDVTNLKYGSSCIAEDEEGKFSVGPVINTIRALLEAAPQMILSQDSMGHTPLDHALCGDCLSEDMDRSMKDKNPSHFSAADDLDQSMNHDFSFQTVGYISEQVVRLLQLTSAVENKVAHLLSTKHRLGRILRTEEQDMKLLSRFLVTPDLDHRMLRKFNRKTERTPHYGDETATCTLRNKQKSHHDCLKPDFEGNCDKKNPTTCTCFDFMRRRKAERMRRKRDKRDSDLISVLGASKWFTSSIDHSFPHPDRLFEPLTYSNINIGAVSQFLAIQYDDTSVLNFLPIDRLRSEASHALVAAEIGYICRRFDESSLREMNIPVLIEVGVSQEEGQWDADCD